MLSVLMNVIPSVTGMSAIMLGAIIQIVVSVNILSVFKVSVVMLTATVLTLVQARSISSPL
jgi:hypothetical protein